MGDARAAGAEASTPKPPRASTMKADDFYRDQIRYGLRTELYDNWCYGMSEDKTEAKPVQTKKAKTRADKQAEHIERIKRTLVASVFGILAGLLSYYFGSVPAAGGLQNDGFLGFMFMLAFVVLQKHTFILMRMDTSKLGGKDWFYQGFMTFAFWFMTWTILLTCFVGIVPSPSYTANVTSGTAPLAVQFNDTSVTPQTSWNWSFTNVTGNNTPVSWSTEQNATQTFGAGNFSIALNASSSAGYYIARQVTFINVTATAAVTPVAT
jgi:hypothetical protein